MRDVRGVRVLRELGRVNMGGSGEPLMERSAVGGLGENPHARFCKGRGLMCGV